MNTTVNRTLSFSAMAAVLALSIFALPAAFAQTIGNNTGTTTSATEDSSLTFTVREAANGDNSTSTAQNTTTSAASNTTKNLAIDVNVVRGESAPITLPLNVTIPESMKNVELCASVMNNSEICQPVLLTIDLTQNVTDAASSAIPTVTGTAFLPYANNANYVPVQSSGSLINIEDTTVTIPITVIVPLTLQIQNAQVCASVLSSGDMNCTQVVMNPEQTSTTTVDVDLTSPTPTVESQDTTTQSTPTSPSGNTTSSDTTGSDSDSTTDDAGSGTTSGNDTSTGGTTTGDSGGSDTTTSGGNTTTA